MQVCVGAQQLNNFLCYKQVKGRPHVADAHDKIHSPASSSVSAISCWPPPLCLYRPLPLRKRNQALAGSRHQWCCCHPLRKVSHHLQERTCPHLGQRISPHLHSLSPSHTQVLQSGHMTSSASCQIKKDLGADRLTYSISTDCTCINSRTDL